MERAVGGAPKDHAAQVAVVLLRTCLLRRRFDERMLRPGGTVSGPTLMAMADFFHWYREDVATDDSRDRSTTPSTAR